MISSCKEYKGTVSTSNVAGPQRSTTSKRSTDNARETLTLLSPTPSTSSTMSSVQEPSDIKMCKLFAFIDDTYRDIRRLHSGLHKENYNSHLMQTINKYKNGCNKIFEEVLQSHEMSKKLAQNIVRTIDIFKELCTSLTDLEEYQHRVCEMMSIFIVCELRLSVDTTIQEKILIGQRIVYVMRKHLVEEIEDDTRYNILRTLVYIPRLFNARDIMCAIFGQFIPIKPVSVVNVLPDKLYILYVIVFYRWMMMQKDDDDKLLIVNFAESFMKPSVTLCTNQLYATHLPRYTTHSTATRTILNNMKFYRDIRNASIIDNALKKIGSIVDLCDDDEDADLVILSTSNSTQFAEIFSSIQLNRLEDSMSHVKLEEKTIIGTVDLTTDEEEPTNSPETIRDRHNKWLNNFQQLAKQFRESQIVIQRQKNSQQISNNQKAAVICLDSDLESEEENSVATENSKSSTPAAKNKTHELVEDLFADNYPPTETPINIGPDLESFDVEDDDDDATKLSSRFLSGTIRTYQGKRNQLESQSNIDMAYRRDSIHISSTPPDNPDDEYSDNQEDDDTDVQDELDLEDESNALTSITLEEPRPRVPYPTYNSTQNNKIVCPQSHTRLPYNNKGQSLQEYEQNQSQTHYSDPSDIEISKKHQKKVHFNTSTVGSTYVAGSPQNMPLKPAIQQSKCKASDASKLSLNKQQQQEHIEAAPTLFRNIFGGSPLSRSSTSPVTSLKSHTKVKKNQKPLKNRRKILGDKEYLNKDNDNSNNEVRREYSIIKTKDALNDDYHSSAMADRRIYSKNDDGRLRKSYDGAAFTTDIIKNDVKLGKRCIVVIRPTKELLEYERKRDELYNEILQEQRRKLKLRELEKQREKERKRLSRREETRDTTAILNKATEKSISISGDKKDTQQRRRQKHNEIFMSIESECETNFQMRTRKQKQQNFKELPPIQIQTGMTESTTSLLNEIDAYLDKPDKKVHDQIEESKTQKENKNTEQNFSSYPINDNFNQQICDNTNDTGQTKMRELNLLADIAQHLSPYQLDIPENNNSPPTSLPSTPALVNLATENKDKSDICKEANTLDKVIVTEQLFIQSVDNLLEKSKQVDKHKKQENQKHEENNQEEEIHDYAHEPKLNVTAVFNSSPVNLSNTPINNDELNSSNNTRYGKIENSLEQILDESIKSVTSPFTPNNESNASRSSQTENESRIPLLISSVESLNRLQHNPLKDSITSKIDDVGIHNKQHSLQNESNQLNSERNFFATKLTNETKDVKEKKSNANGTSTLGSVESSVICGDLSNMSSEIAEPSPVVTDMSDNSNESIVSKSFAHNNLHQSTTEARELTDIPVINLPDLPLEMPSIIPQSASLPQLQENSIPMSSSTPLQLENDFNPLDSSLNTPIKQQSLPEGESCTREAKADLITSLKFTLQQQSEIESDNTPLKSTLEPESDTNVTKFLDLILNKTVTDAESEARDKIIKELNALTTADTSSTELTIQGAESIVHETKIEVNNKHVDSEVSLEQTENVVNPVQIPIDKNKSINSSTIHIDKNITAEKCQTDKLNDDLTDILVNSKIINKECNIESYSAASIEQSCKTSSFPEPPITKPEQSNTKATLILENKEIFPPKANTVKETSELINTELISTKPNYEMSTNVKQTFNIKCRVRLKRLNVAEHCKNSKKETWMAIPITKPEEPESLSKDVSICDNSRADKTPSIIKKPCLKYNSKRAEEDLIRKCNENFLEITEATDAKKAKLDVEDQNLLRNVEVSQNQQKQQQETTHVLTSNTPASGVLFNYNNNSSTMKSKSKNSKTVTFDLSNLNEDIKGNVCNHKPHKTTRPPRKLPDNTLRAAETLQIFVNTINDCAHTPPAPEFNRKRSPIKNKCIAEDEAPRPPLQSTLMDNQACKKICTEKSRSQITSPKCKDQLVSSLTTPSISNITSDITTARIYTSSPLDQTLPEYDVDNVDTVADSELILPTTTGSLRRKLKRPKKSMTNPVPVDGITTDDISNQPECNGEDDTDAVVDNEDDVFAEELLPIPTANEHILEEIVSARTPHIGTGTVIREDYMTIEATATVPVYLFNDESRDLATPEPIQSSDTNVVDSSSFLNASSTATVTANTPTTTSVIGNLEKSMLSPSEHEVSSTQETFYQTPTKSKQIDAFGEKATANKDKSSCSSNAISNQNKADDKSFQSKEDDQTSSTTGLLQNNQVDTTNHSPEMCTLTLTGSSSSSSTSTSVTSNRKIRKASTHDEILFNELQQQQQQQQKSLQQSKRKTMFCAESTSDNSNIVKNKTASSNLDDIKTNGSLCKIEDKFKKLLKDGVNKKDKSEISNQSSKELCIENTKLSGGGSSPSTTTINDEKSARPKRKKLKSSKSEKVKHHEKPSKLVLKASKLTAHIPTNPLKITIPKSKHIRLPPNPSPPTTSSKELKEGATVNSFNNSDNKNVKSKDKFLTMTENKNSDCTSKTDIVDGALNCSNKSKHSYNSAYITSEIIDPKTIVFDSEKGQFVLNANTNTVAKEKTNVDISNVKKKTKANNNTDNLSNTINSTSSSFSLTFTTTASNCSNINNNSNLIFAKDKYDLIKSKDKHHHHLQENKEKPKDKIINEVKKYANHNKPSINSEVTNKSTNRHHKTSAKEKKREKHNKDKHKTLDNSLPTASNVLKSITQKTASSNLSSSSAILTTTSSHAKKSSGSKLSKHKMQDVVNDSTNTTVVLKPKTNLSASQLSSSSSSVAPGQITHTSPTITTILTSTSSTSPIAVTISSNHVRKKLKTK